MCQSTSVKLHIWPLADSLKNIFLWSGLLLCMAVNVDQSISTVRTTL